MISTLLKEINKIGSINSGNQALLEDYVNIINQKDLEITELKHALLLISSKTKVNEIPNDQPMSSSISPNDSIIDRTSPTTSSSTHSSPQQDDGIGGKISPRLANMPPPPPNKAPPMGLTLDYKLLGRGGRNKNNKSITDVIGPHENGSDRKAILLGSPSSDGGERTKATTRDPPSSASSLHLSDHDVTRTIHGGHKTKGRQLQLHSNQDDSPNNDANTNEIVENDDEHDHHKGYYDDDDDDDDENSQTEEEGSPVAVIINRDYSYRSSRSSVAKVSSSGIINSNNYYSSCRLPAVIAPDNNMPSTSNSYHINYNKLKAKKDTRYLSPSTQHSYTTRSATALTNSNIPSSLTQSSSSTNSSITKWSDGRKHENLFSRVPIFKGSRLDDNFFVGEDDEDDERV